MNYHNITSDDMLNGDGLRVVLWCSYCGHNCKGCQNPQTHHKDSGILFDPNAEEELFEKLSQPHISGITFSGGDPLGKYNTSEVLRLVKKCKKTLPNKNIWIYSGYTYEEILMANDDKTKIVNIADILVDGRFNEALKDLNLRYRGSSNQRIIDIRETIKCGRVIERED